MVRFLAIITDEQMEKLDALRDSSGASKSFMLRQALDAYLNVEVKSSVPARNAKTTTGVNPKLKAAVLSEEEARRRILWGPSTL